MGVFQDSVGGQPRRPEPGDADARADRLLERLDTLFEIGRLAGTNRAGLGEGEQQAFELVRGWMVDADLDVATDPGGNLIGRARGSAPALPEVWSGSHLDTPPDGGRFDGALGVLAALDAIEAIAASGGAKRTLAVIAFRLEEGCRFGRGVFGSRAVCGMLDGDEADLRDADGISLGEAFGALGLGRLPERGWLDPAPFAYVETHIEQGPTLAAAGAPLGVVTSIAGMAGFELVFRGRRGHAGTVPMALRSDALGAAARFVERAHEVARSIPGAVATIGRLTVSPGATNTIPNMAELFVDVRAPDTARLDALSERVVAAAHAAAGDLGCEVEVAERWRYDAVPMSERPAAALRNGIAELGLEPVELPSGAGHDAAIMAMAGVPSAMLFVRSDAGGVSHAPEESTGRDAIAACVRTLEPALRELAEA
ncbi:MAG: allantoate deiminase [Gaiellales bacterium]|nr:allantoate deiminase [Gaiellales bacterium]